MSSTVNRATVILRLGQRVRDFADWRRQNKGVASNEAAADMLEMIAAELEQTTVLVRTPAIETLIEFMTSDDERVTRISQVIGEACRAVGPWSSIWTGEAFLADLETRLRAYA